MANMSVSINYAGYLRRDVKSHTEKVKSLYKRALRNLESWKLPDRLDYRFHALLMRERFEKTRDIRDMRLAKVLLSDGEEELWQTRHYQPLFFAYSPGGVCYERYQDYPDWHLDGWHPLFKAMYPTYFANREKRKMEYVQMYESDYGKARDVIGVSEHTEYLEVDEEDEKTENQLGGSEQVAKKA